MIIKRLSLFAITLVAATLLLPGMANAVESGGIGGRPANPDPNNPRTSSIFIFSLDPGQQARSAVKIYNNSGAEKTIDVYAVDAEASSGGAFACAQKVEEKRDVGSWIKLGKEPVTLASGATEVVAFTLETPKNAAAGEHGGCIVIQEANQTPQSTGDNISLSFRSAIRVAVTIKGDIKKELAFTRLESKSDKNNKLLINAALRNSGNVSLDTEIDVYVKSIFGTMISKSGGEFPVLASGEREFNFVASEPYWGGVYFLNATASYNPDTSAGLGNGKKSANVSQSKMILTAPKPLAAVVELAVLLGIIGLGTYFWRRTTQYKRWHRHGEIYEVKQGESIQQVAEKFGLPWKTIARVNHLKAPYHLGTGDRLKLLPETPATNSQKPRKSKK